MDETVLCREFLAYSASKLRELASRIDVCLGQLTDEQVWARGKETENAVGNLVLHLCGNVGQWIVSNIGGRPDTRVRDEEFAARGNATRAELRDRLRTTMESALGIIEGLTSEQLTPRHTIQGYDVSVMEAAELGFNRHLEAVPKYVLHCINLSAARTDFGGAGFQPAGRISSGRPAEGRQLWLRLRCLGQAVSPADRPQAGTYPFSSSEP